MDLLLIQIIFLKLIFLIAALFLVPLAHAMDHPYNLISPNTILSIGDDTTIHPVKAEKERSKLRKQRHYNPEDQTTEEISKARKVMQTKGTQEVSQLWRIILFIIFSICFLAILLSVVLAFTAPANALFIRFTILAGVSFFTGLILYGIAARHKKSDDPN